jgi:prepilin-type N-terminal cleavage/methylation domain-containing protein
MASIATATNCSRRAFTLVELMVAVAVGSVILIAVMSLSYFSARSYAAITNYVDLDNYSRNALDQMTREIRQADRLISGTEHNLLFEHTHPVTKAVYQTAYVFDPNARTLTRTQGGQSTVLLRECDYLKFSVFQRNPIKGTYDQWKEDWSSPQQVKVVQLSWICSRTILGARVNTESVQSAKVVIRKR